MKNPAVGAGRSGERNFAASRVRLNASTELRPAFARPRVAMPMGERARSTRRGSLPALIRSSTA